MSKWAPYLIVCLLLTVTSATGEWGEPVNLGPDVNFIGKDYYPAISADGTTLYFTSNDRPGGYGDDDIWISAWDGVEWGVPVNAGPYVNSDSRDLSPSITSDGTHLYFVSYGRAGGYGGYDVWISTWDGVMWGPPVNAGPNVNSAAYEFTAKVSFDGNELYFSSDRLGGWGSDDLYVSKWDSINSEWGPAVNLDTTINQIGREYCPSVTVDGSTLYFARWVPGHPDIFVSEWEDTIWGMATNLGPPVNTLTWDNGPSISSDGLKLYFASSRDTSNPAVQDIWVSEWVPGVQEEAPGARRSTEAFLTCVPNPFSSAAVIGYSVPEPGHVSLRIYDTAGRLVRTLADGIKEPGTQEVAWDGSNDRGEPLTSGIYFCRVEAGRHSATNKLHLVR